MNRIYQLAFTQTKTNHAVYQIVESLARIDYFTFFFEKKKKQQQQQQTNKQESSYDFFCACPSKCISTIVFFQIILMNTHFS